MSKGLSLNLESLNTLQGVLLNLFVAKILSAHYGGGLFPGLGYCHFFLDSSGNILLNLELTIDLLLFS